MQTIQNNIRGILNQRRVLIKLCLLLDTKQPVTSFIHKTRGKLTHSFRTHRVNIRNKLLSHDYLFCILDVMYSSSHPSTSSNIFHSRKSSRLYFRHQMAELPVPSLIHRYSSRVNLTQCLASFC